MVSLKKKVNYFKLSIPLNICLSKIERTEVNSGLMERRYKIVDKEEYESNKRTLLII